MRRRALRPSFVVTFALGAAAIPGGCSNNDSGNGGCPAEVPVEGSPCDTSPSVTCPFDDFCPGSSAACQNGSWVVWSYGGPCGNPPRPFPEAGPDASDAGPDAADCLSSLPPCPVFVAGGVAACSLGQAEQGVCGLGEAGAVSPSCSLLSCEGGVSEIACSDNTAYYYDPSGAFFAESIGDGGIQGRLDSGICNFKPVCSVPVDAGCAGGG
jgi:hypothetical protein